jgi:hypothetical protein
MSTSSLLGAERAPQQASGRDAEALGPSDTSDSGSDILGATRLKTDAEEGELGGATPVALDSDSDSMGTGVRAEAVPEGARDGADIAPDRIARSKDAMDAADVSIDTGELDELADEPYDEDGLEDEDA